jgi:hypothetical protein
MRAVRQKGVVAAGILAAAAFTPAGAFAGGFDGSANLVCSAIDVVACVEGPDCVQGQSRTFDLAQFIFIDFKGKIVRATDESGIKAVSPIKNLESTGSQLILQGVENGHGWGISIDRKTGRMTTTVSGDLASFMVFGACTAI